MLAAGAVLTGLLLTEVLLDGWLGRWDVDVEESLVRQRTSRWNDITSVTSAMGDTLTVVGVGSVAVVVLLARRWWRPALLLTTALVVEVTVFLTTANVIDRDRPPVPQLDKAPPTSSYPSGHTAAAVALYVGLALVVSARLRRLALRVLVWAAGLLVVAGVATGRLYRAMHHPTDVTAGVLIGAASLVVAVLAVRATVTRPGESARHEAGDTTEVAG